MTRYLTVLITVDYDEKMIELTIDDLTRRLETLAETSEVEIEIHYENLLADSEPEDEQDRDARRQRLMDEDGAE